MSMRWVDGQIHFGMVRGLICDRENARRIASHLITKRRTFAVQYMDEKWFVFVPEELDIEYVRHKLPGILFEVSQYTF